MVQEVATGIIMPVVETPQEFKPTKVVEDQATTMTLEIIGPRLAKKYLAVAAPNRAIREGNIAKYARDMLADSWHSSVIRFDTEGQLRDGQHRLKAILLSKSEQLFWVERNVPVDAFRSIDTGVKRTMGDQLSIAGEQNTNVLATGIRFAAWLENFPGISFASSSQLPMSPDEFFLYLENNQGIRESVHFGLKMQTLRYSPSLATALHYLGVKSGHKEKADAFWTQMSSGVGISEHTGAWALRKQVIENQLRLPDSRLDRNLIFALSIKAWNYWKHDMLVRRLQWLRAADEPFPTFGKRPKITRDGKGTEQV